ncbi:hypothetical protein [Methylobacterium sp. BE186]|uniref:hypothetical protein n=1 Tax=Methylobacterium sp. BE186 TaxID=2817715 RepID=UPI00286D5374|nr:hypothetical protein [Methylobacterium sp. BE186]
MVTLTRWGNTLTDQLNGFKVAQTTAVEDQVSAADNATDFFAVAYRSTEAGGATSIWLKALNAGGGLFDQGLLKISTGPGIVSRPVVAGAGDGFAVAYESRSALGEPADVKVRFVGAVGLVPGELTLGSAEDDDHGAVVAGFQNARENADKTVDAKTILSTGFNVAWIATPKTLPAGADARYGAVKFQRYAIDPTNPDGVAPKPAGLDGVVGGTDGDAVLTLAASGRNVAMTSLHDGESVIAWIDPNNHVRFAIFDADGSQNDIRFNPNAAGAGGTLASDAAAMDTLVDAMLGTANAASKLVIANIAGTTDFVIAWVETVNGITSVVAQVFAAGPVANTWTVDAAREIRYDLPGTFGGTFSIAGLGEGTSQLVLTYGVTNSDSTTDVVSVAFATDGTHSSASTVFQGVTRPDGFASTGLAGDRAVIVGSNGDVTAQFLDTRDYLGPPFFQEGDRHRADGRVDAKVDTMIGTSFDDDLRPGLAADTVWAGSGDDLIEGSVGSDAIHGGANGSKGDTVWYTGLQSAYSVKKNADGSLSVAHNGGTEGPDTLWDVEHIAFNVHVKADGTLDRSQQTILDLATDVQPRSDSPSHWGNTNADLNGFQVDAATSDQSRPAIADNFGEVFGVAALAGTGAGTQVRLQLYNHDGTPDAFLPLPMRLDDGSGTISAGTGVALVGWGDGYEAVWGEATSDGVRLAARFLGPASIIGNEVKLGLGGPPAAGQVVDQHSVAMAGYEKVVTLDAAGKPLDVRTGFNMLWVETDRAGSHAAGNGALGHVYFQRYEVQATADGASFQEPKAAGLDGQADATLAEGASGSGPNNAVFELTGGALGRDPSVAVAHDGESVISWIERDGTGQDRLRVRLLDQNGAFIEGVALPDGVAVANGQLARAVALGAGNFGLFWVADAGNGDLVVLGQTFVLGGAPGTFVAGEIVEAGRLGKASVSGGPGFTGEFNVVGLGEDNDGGVVTYSVFENGQTAIKAFNFDGGANGFGHAVTLNTATGLTEKGHGIAGLVSDRAVVVWNEVSAGDSDIRVQIIDTREGPQEIFGDLVRPDGTTQARRDLIVGTVNDDFINGQGLDDTIQAGMGSDTVIGGAGNDHLDGGQERLGDTPGHGTDDDVAVYSGTRAQYSVTLNGDGSFTVKDMRNPREPATNAGPDGRDVVKDFEHLKFADGAVDMTAFLPLAPNAFVPPTPDGTYAVRPWGPHADTGDFIVNDGALRNPAGTAIANPRAGLQHDPVAVAMQDNYAFLWVEDDGAGGRSHLYLKAYTSLGEADAAFGIGAGAAGVIRHELGDGTGLIAHVAANVAGDLGVAAAWEETASPGATSRIKVGFVSALTGNLGEIAVQDHGTGAQTGASVAGYELLDANNKTAEFGFNVAYGQGGRIYVDRFVLQTGTAGPEVLPGSSLGSSVDLGAGRGASTAMLHDGQLVTSWIDDQGRAQYAILDPARIGTGADPILARSPAGGDGAATAQAIVGVGFNFILVKQDAGGLVTATIHNATGDPLGSLDAPLMLTGLAPGATFQVVPTAAEQGFAIYWHDAAAHQVKGQVYDAAGIHLGGIFDAFPDGSTTLGVPGVDPSFSFSVAGLEDGRQIVAAEGSATAGATEQDIVGQILDTRQPGNLIIGPREGAPRDVISGTAGDDIIDGRALADELHGAGGNDLILGGSENDLLFGDTGDDILIGGSENDTLSGGDGDDLLIGGFGIDDLDGNAGSDTVSYRGEVARFLIDLLGGPTPADGTTRSNRDPNTGATNAAFQAEDTLHNIENAVGGEAADEIRGTNGANVLEGRGGDDIIDGRLGDDTAVFSGKRADYDITQDASGTIIVKGARGDGLADGRDTVSNVEHFRFTDGDFTVQQLFNTNTGGGGTGTPKITFGTNSPSVLENTEHASITTLTTSGFPTGTPVLSLVSNPGGLFAIENGVLVVAPTKALDYETARTYSLVVQARTADGTTATATLNLAVGDVNEAATTLTAAGTGTNGALTVLENSPGGTLVAKLAANDPDVGDSLVYTLGGTNAALFQIVGNELQVKAGALIDYETGPRNLSVDVTVRDGAGHTLTQTFGAIAIGNVSGNFTGTAANETFAGTSEEDTIRAGGGNDVLNGQAGDDQLFGEAGTDRLDGGLGADRMDGGAGNDTFVVDNVGDVVIEGANGGTDTVESAISFSLAALPNVENVTLTGSASINATGNGGQNVLFGNSGNNVLDGGADRDAMTGGDGNDTYVVDNTGDVVTETNANAAGGIDTVLASVNYRLTNNVENLTLTGNAQTGQGNALANELRGNAQNNTLDGDLGNDRLFGFAGSDTLRGGEGNDFLAGGAGNDTLTGGNGNDVFDFEIGTGRDTVTDFRNGQDRVDVSAFLHTGTELNAYLSGTRASGNYVTAAGNNVELHHLANGVDEVLVLTGVTRAQIDASDFLIG